MKKFIVGLMAFAMTITVGVSADNFLRGFVFSGASGLKTGDDLEDLITQAVWTNGAISTANADRLFDSTQFEITTDSAGTPGTNVISVKSGGISSTEILDGTITTNDLAATLLNTITNTSNNANFLAARDMYPKIALTSNMFSVVSSAGTPIPASQWSTFLDDDNSTATTTGSATPDPAIHNYILDLGTAYAGVVSVKLANVSSTSGYRVGLTSYMLKSGAYGSGYQEPFSYDLQAKTLNVDSSTNYITKAFSGRYLVLMVANPDSGNLIYKLFDFSVWGNTNAYDNMGGF